MKAKMKHQPKLAAKQEAGKHAATDWIDAVTAVASEIDALADAILTLDEHPTVTVLIAVMLEKATKLRQLMRQKGKTASVVVSNN